MRRVTESKLLKLLLISTLVLLIGTSGYLIFSTGFFTIKTVDVNTDGIICTSDEKLRETAQVLGKNFFFLNQNLVEKKLKEKFLCINSVKISRKLPNKVSLTVLRREGVAIIVILKNREGSSSAILDNFAQTTASTSTSAVSSVPNGSLQAPSAMFNPDINDINASFLVDAEGVVFSKDSQNLNYPKVYLEGNNLSLGKNLGEGIVKNSLKILNQIKIFGIDTKEAKMYSQKILLINATPRMLFALDKNIDPQLASLQLILEKAKIDEEKIEFIDLRFDKPVIKVAPKKKNG